MCVTELLILKFICALDISFGTKESSTRGGTNLCSTFGRSIIALRRSRRRAQIKDFYFTRSRPCENAGLFIVIQWVEEPEIAKTEWTNLLDCEREHRTSSSLPSCDICSHQGFSRITSNQYFLIASWRERHEWKSDGIGRFGGSTECYDLWCENWAPNRCFPRGKCNRSGKLTSVEAKTKMELIGS